MKKAVLTIALVVAAAAGCKKNDTESVRREQVRLMNELGDTLASIKDEASAKAAVPKVAALTQKSEELRKRMEALPKLTQEQEDALRKKFEPELQAVVSKLMKQSMRVATVPGGADVMKAMRPTTASSDKD